MAGKHKRHDARRRHGSRKDPGESGRNRSRELDDLPIDEMDPDHVWLQDSQVALSIPMERLLRVVGSAIDEDRLEGPEDVERFLVDFSEERYAGALEALRASGPREKAQQLAYDALLDAETDEEALKLARQALEIDPDCVDARMVVAECIHTEHVAAFIADVEEAVRVGERALGEGFLETHEGEVWDALEARPYLRARYRLADACRLNGRAQDAIDHLEALLKLNPLDHQRVRDPLLACYLASDRLDDARRLLLQFPLDDSAVFHWGRVLERLLSEDPSGAYRALKKANEQNPFAEAYLTFAKKPPAEMPETYVPGAEEEAVHCLYILGTALAAHPAAITWVRELRDNGWK